MKVIEERLKTIKAGRVLDIATGRGEFIQIIKNEFNSFEHIVGIDMNEQLVRQTQKAFPENNIEIFRMSADHLEFADESFDTVTISNSLHHMEQLPTVLKEILRVLRGGGTLLISEMYGDGNQTEAQQTQILMHHWFADADRLNGTYHGHTFTKQELVDIVQQLHLNKVEEYDYYWPTDNPKDKAMVESLTKNCNDMLKRLTDKPEAESLCAAGRDLMERLLRTGIASPSRMLFIGTKKKTRKK